jgi:hypothetical protein
MLRKEIDHEDHERARAQVIALLGRERDVDTLREILAKTPGEWAETEWPDVPPSTLRLLGLALDRLLRKLLHRPSVRRIVLAPFHDWYGHRDRGLAKDAVDVLIDLNRWGRGTDNEGSREQIEDLLIDAFLADLRAAFADLGDLLNCAVLLDNVDTEVGQRFLHVLSRFLRQHATVGGLAAAPLTVVATSRGAVLADLPGSAVLDLSGGPGRHTQQPGVHWWARYRLGDLTLDAVDALVTALSLPAGNNERLARMVYDLTAGHPASTRLLLNSVTEHPKHRDDLDALLDQQEPDASMSPRFTVAARLLARLLVDFPDDMLADLITCAAARDHSHVRVLVMEDQAAPPGQRAGLLDGGQVSLDVIRGVLWPSGAGAGQVVLRRLLLRLLSAREGAHPARWQVVFDRLRRHSGGDDALYYAMACGDLPAVTGALRERLAQPKPWPELWLRSLAEIVSAPRRRPVDAGSPANPAEQLRAVLGGHPGVAVDPLARLLAAEWIVADPLTDANRATLHRQLDADYRQVASPLVDADPLLRAAAGHQKQTPLWR